ncbi:hypothetical protein [Bradyrhizobium archetypum]|uniref:Uncharacterized protein n=1 Tax=Bradyrhizobium archetypum TaxID=2721160 RepID=A0A7Y4M5R9_9BRAD|nr:hypothetical protein [Bradyrhizobium archetypum]NOJ50864.1 hypothetical protein [Bradyrhizobium archetypum]
MLLDIDPVAILAEKCADGEAVPEVVRAGPAMVAKASWADLVGQAPENTMNILVQQSAAALSHEEVRTAARPEVSIPPFGVAAESRAGCRMQGHEAICRTCSFRV